MKTSCTIIVSHFESLNFLRAFIRQTRKQKNDTIEQHIIISDQSCRNIHSQVVDEFGSDEDITVVWSKALYSGFGIDHIMRHVEINTEYIAQMHVDAFGITDTYLKLPIALIEEYNFSFVGQLHFININSSIYPPNPFFSMSPTFNVAKTETYKEMSLEAGFTRFHNRTEGAIVTNNNDWSEWASDDYVNKGSDDDTVAFHWEDTHRQHNKLGLAISGYIQSSFGRLIDDIVFHFGSVNESKGVFNQMPELYQHYTRKINENYSDELINEMVQIAKKNKPNGSEILSRNFWNGTTKESSPPTEALNKRIEELKNI